MLDQTYQDNATLRFVTGPLDREDVMSSLKYTFDEVRSMLEENDPRLTPHRAALSNIRFDVNVVTNREREKFGYAFVHVKPPEAYFLLLGRLPNGEVYYEEIPDPDWKSDPVDFDWKSYTIDGSTSNDEKATALYHIWLSQESLDKDDQTVYQSKENRAQYHEYLRHRHEPNLIKVAEPVLQVASMEYTPLQLSLLREKAEATGRDLSSISPFHEYIITPAEVSSPKDKDLNPYTLKTTAPLWVSEEMIQAIFSPYNTDPNTYSREMTDATGRHRRDMTYPIVRGKIRELTNRDGTTIKINNIYVEFSQALASKYDAAIARRMCRQVLIANPETGETHSLLFDYWRSNPHDKSKPFEKGSARTPGYGKAGSDQRIVHSIKNQRPGLFKPAPYRR